MRGAVHIIGRICFGQHGTLGEKRTGERERERERGGGQWKKAGGGQEREPLYTLCTGYIQQYDLFAVRPINCTAYTLYSYSLYSLFIVQPIHSTAY
jgi:hypothetical protein